jgi:LacI family transcriptional regulator
MDKTMPGIHIEGLKQLAERTGLSVSTVSRVLNGKAESARISTATSQRVMEEARRQGIVINTVARGLRLRTTQTLGLLIPDISNPFFAALARQVEKASRERGFSVILGDSEENSEIESHNARLMQSRQVDALVVAPVGDRHDHLRKISLTLPLILVDRVLPELAVPSVSADNFAGARMAVEHLVSVGHQRIGCVQGLPASSTNAARVSGFRSAILSSNLNLSDDSVCGDGYSIESARNAALRLLSSPLRPTAIVALGNLLALGVLQAARELNLTVPHDLSLIGFDDQPWLEWISPPLTTVAQPIDELGAAAMNLCFEKLEQNPPPGNPPRQMLLPMKLIPRESVSNPRT